MKPQELRIGNYISDIHASDRFFAPVIKIDITRCYYGSFHSSYSDLKPIPLTEQWLSDFGADKKDEDHFFIELGLGFGDKVLCITLLKGNETTAFLAERTTLTPSIIHLGGICNYVHQLQNLYFALKGEELERNSQPNE